MVCKNEAGLLRDWKDRQQNWMLALHEEDNKIKSAPQQDIDNKGAEKTEVQGKRSTALQRKRRSDAKASTSPNATELTRSQQVIDDDQERHDELERDKKMAQQEQ